MNLNLQILKGENKNSSRMSRFTRDEAIQLKSKFAKQI